MGVRERVREREFERERVCSENRESLSPSKHFKTSRPLLSYSVEYFSKLNDSKDLRLIDYSSRTTSRSEFRNLLVKKLRNLVRKHSSSHHSTQSLTQSLSFNNTIIIWRERKRIHNLFMSTNVRYDIEKVGRNF